MGKQLRLIDEKLDTPLVQAADRYVAAKDQLEVVGGQLEAAGARLLGLMHAAGKMAIHHGGKKIERVSSAAKEKLKMKAETPTPLSPSATLPLENKGERPAARPSTGLRRAQSSGSEKRLVKGSRKLPHR